MTRAMTRHSHSTTFLRLALLMASLYASSSTAPAQLGTGAEDPMLAECQRVLAEQAVLQPETPPQLLEEMMAGLALVDYGALTPQGMARDLREAFDRYLLIEGTPQADPVQANIIMDLFKIAGERTLPFIAAKTLDPSPLVRRRAGGLLGDVMFGAPLVSEAASPWSGLLQLQVMQTYDIDSVVRLGATHGAARLAGLYSRAGHVCPTVLIQRLCDLCADADATVAYAAAKALHALDRDDLVPADLMEKLRADPEIHETWDQQADEQ